MHPSDWLFLRSSSVHVRRNRSKESKQTTQAKRAHREGSSFCVSSSHSINPINKHVHVVKMGGKRCSQRLGRPLVFWFPILTEEYRLPLPAGNSYIFPRRHRVHASWPLAVVFAVCASATIGYSRAFIYTETDSETPTIWTSSSIN